MTNALMQDQLFHTGREIKFVFTILFDFIGKRNTILPMQSISIRLQNGSC